MIRQVKINNTIGSPIVTLTQAKDFLRVDNDDDDDIITRMIDSATKWCEDYISKDIVSKERTYYQSEVTEAFELPYAPILSITSVKSDGLDIDYKEKGVDGSFVELTTNREDVKVVYTTEGLDAELFVDAVCALVTSYYDNRSDFIVGSKMEIPTGVKGKLNNQRKMFF